MLKRSSKGLRTDTHKERDLSVPRGLIYSVPSNIGMYCSFCSMPVNHDIVTGDTVS
jgi:hypothetical protein